VPLQAAHEVFAGKEVKFFSKAFENKSDFCCFSLRFSLSLSLSAFFLIRALLSDDEKKNHRATRFVCFFFFFFFYSSSFPYFVGEVLLLKTTPRTPFLSQSGRVCVLVVLLSSSRIFFFGCYFLLALACALLFTLDERVFYLQKKTLFPSIQCVGNTLKFLS
jgi:hypothetical protein